MILSARVKVRLCRALPSQPFAEERFEKIGKLLLLRAPGTTAIGELEARIPVGGRLEVLPRMVALANLVIGCAFLRVAEDLMGLTDLLEPFFGSLILVQVGMELSRERSVGAFDLVLRGGFLHAENLVVVLVFHRGAVPAEA